jgi:hypothetical protein
VAQTSVCDRKNKTNLMVEIIGHMSFDICQLVIWAEGIRSRVNVNPDSVDQMKNVK